jgi:ATP-dependent DNA helicase RecG
VKMPIDVKEITSQQHDKIIGQLEGHFLDFKAKELSPSKLERHLCAFANADGGELYIGVKEDVTGKFIWDGFPLPEDGNSHIQHLEKIFPLGTYFDFTFLKAKHQNGYVLKINVLKTPDVKFTSDKKCYVRKGAQSVYIEPGEELKRLEYSKGITSYENELLQVDTSEITNQVPTIQFMLEIVPTAEPDKWLKKQQLIKSEKPTVAAILLFNEEPQALLPKRSGVKIYRYKSKEEIGTRETMAFDPLTIEGHLYDQIKMAVDKTIEIIQSVSVQTPRGLVKIEYPRDTLHEIITNSVIHRDYSLADDIHIRIFDNRIEVESPGKLPAHITTENILNERYSRNGNIVRILNKFPNPPNKDVGEGLNTAFDAMRKVRLKDPVILQKEASVVVSIKHEPLASPQELIMEYLKTHDSINNFAAREICHIGSENVVKRIFEKMIDGDLIERIPGLKGKKIAYRKFTPE